MTFPRLSPTLPPMMNPLKTALRKTSSVAGAATDIFLSDMPHPAVFPLALASVAAVTAVALGTFLATETGLAILSELRRRKRLKEPQPESPSLRGKPTPEEIEADGTLEPRTLSIRLRLGSRLADLEPTVDSGTHYEVLKGGARRIAARGRGVKGWLADRRITINYSTLMRYKRLAVRLRRLLELDARLPLEWLLPGEQASRKVPEELERPFFLARRRLRKLMGEQRNFSRLSRYVEQKLGIERLLSVRRNGSPAKPVGKRMVVGSRSVLLEDTQVEATRREMAQFLSTPGRTPRLEKLRCEALEWLETGTRQNGN